MSQKIKALIKNKYGTKRWYLKISRIATRIRVGLYKHLTNEEFIKRDFKYIYGYDVDLNNPKGYHEVLSWYKCTDLLRNYCVYADKFTFRQYVAEQLSEDYLIPLLAVWEKPEDIDFSQLPEEFVMIPSHLSGYHYVKKSDEPLNTKKLTHMSKQWLKTNYYEFTREIQYKDAKPRILIYKYLKDHTGDLTDYKFFIVDNKIEFMIAVINRHTALEEIYMDENGDIMDIYRYSTKKYDRTFLNDHYEELRRIALQLAQPFPFVRVDLYCVDNQIYVGELTFTHGDSREKFDNNVFNIEIGERIYRALKKRIEG